MVRKVAALGYSESPALLAFLGVPHLPFGFVIDHLNVHVLAIPALCPVTRVTSNMSSLKMLLLHPFGFQFRLLGGSDPSTFNLSRCSDFQFSQLMHRKVSGNYCLLAC